MSCDLDGRVIERSRTFGGRPADNLLIQCVDEHDASTLDSEFEYIKQHSQESFLLLALKVDSWNSDLSPWKAPAVWGNEGFGNGASNTLGIIKDRLIPRALASGKLSDSAAVFLGGYSLAGFFALWAGYECPMFKGIVAASPSVWFPGWMDYSSNNRFLCESCYLSLGRKEEKTRNPVMATVGDCIRAQSELLSASGVHSVLEWNEGNHFTEPDIRTAKGFAWIMR